VPWAEPVKLENSDFSLQEEAINKKKIKTKKGLKCIDLTLLQKYKLKD
jgi:hypothetical protein